MSPVHTVTHDPASPLTPRHLAALKNQVRFLSESLAPFTLPSPRGSATLENMHSLPSRRFDIPWEKHTSVPQHNVQNSPLRTGMLSVPKRRPLFEQPGGEKPGDEELRDEATGFSGFLVLRCFRRESGEVKHGHTGISAAPGPRWGCGDAAPGRCPSRPRPAPTPRGTRKAQGYPP